MMHSARIIRLDMPGTRHWVIATRKHAPTRRTTIADVAREAGVNKGTVSRALRGISGVGPSTRERIIETALRLDFSASHLASSLASGHSQTVGIVLTTLRSWYFSEFASGASEILTPAGYRVELINLDVYSEELDDDPARFRQLFRELGAGRGRDALLFAGTLSGDGRGMVESVGVIPTGAIGAPLTSVSGIFVNHREGGRLVAQHLLALGHRRIAILDGRMPGADLTLWELRTRGLHDVLRPAGLEVADEDVFTPGDCHAPDGEAAMEALLSRSDPRPTAVFCHTDEMAFGAMAVLRRHAVRVPEDISIAAFDDHPMAQYWGLTTVSQHAHQQGVRAAYALVDVLEGEVPDHVTRPDTDLRVELIVRETTGPAPKG